MRLLFSQMNTDSGAVWRPPLSADAQRNSNMMAFDPVKEGNIAQERDHLMLKPSDPPGKAL